MQQPCHKCGYDSDRPTRFCRQCGARLFVENEVTSASTRQYVPQQSANPYDGPYQSQLAQAQAAPDGRFDSQTPDTSRLYHTPMAPNLPSYPSNYHPTESKKSGAWKWVLIALMCIVMVSAGIGAMVILAIRAKHTAAEPARDQLPENPNRPQEIARTDEEPGKSVPPIPPPPPSTSGADLNRYKYPNAVVKNSVGGFGNDVITMSTSDSVSKVRDYYKKQLGARMINNENGDTVSFKISNSQMIVITINEDKRGSDKTEITLIKTSWQLPKMN